MAWAQAQARLPQRGFRSSSDSGSKRCQRRLLTAASAGGKGEGAGSRTRQLWVKTRSKETFTAAVEAGVNRFLFESPQRETALQWLR